MLKLDLMPEDVERKRKERKRNIAIAIMVLAVIVVFGVYSGFALLIKNQAGKLNGLEMQNTALSGEIEKLQTDLEGALLAQRQLENLDKLLNKRAYWKTFFTNLGSVTLKDVFYSSFSGDIDSYIVSLPSFAKNYKAVARQLKVWENAPLIKGIEVTSAQVDSYKEAAVIGFGAKLTFSEKAWQK